MTEAKINSNVGVNINPTGLAAAADTVQKKINDIVKAIEKAGTATNDQLKQMAVGLKQVQTLQNARNTKANNLLGDFGDNAKLGQQARALGEFRQAFDATARASDVLRGRLRAIRDEEGKLLRSGKELSSAAVLRGDRIKETATQYNKLGNEITNLRGRIALLSEDGRKAFAPMLKSLDELDRKNAAAFSNGRRSSFTPELTTTRQAVQSLKEQITTREKLEKQTRLNAAALKEEGEQILKNTIAQREAALAAAVRSGQSQIRNAALIGSGRFAGAGDQTQNQISLTERLTIAKAKLNKELSRTIPRAKYLDDYINQIKQLEKELGLAIALQQQFQNSQTTPKGGFIDGFKQQFKGLTGIPEEGGFGAGALVARIAGYAAAATAIYGMIRATQEAITFTIKFEDALASLQAISGATDTEMTRLGDTLFDVSKRSSNSVLELAESATILAQAGFSSGEIDQLLQNVTALADASGSTAKESVDILTSTLGAFQLGAEESTRVVDGLVAVLNSSKLSMQQAQLGLQYLGATAKENSITFEELNAIMGTAADAGIRSGSTAATGTRQFLIDLIDPSKKLVAELEKVGLTTKDIDVKTLGLVEVLNRLNQSGFQAYGALETRAAAMYEVLSSNIPKLQELTAVQAESGTAADAQAVKLESLSSKWQILLNRLAEVGAMIGTVVIPVVKGLVDILTVVVDGVKVFFEAIGSTVSFIGQFASAIGDLYSNFTLIGPLIVPLGDNFESVAGSTLNAADAADTYGASLESIDASVRAAAEGEEALQTALNQTEAEMSAQKLEVQALDVETSKLITRKSELESQTGRVSAEINNLSSRFPGLRAEFDKTAGGAAGLIQAMFNLEAQAQKTLRALAATRAYQYSLKTEQSKETGRDQVRQSLDLLKAENIPQSLRNQITKAIRSGDGGLAFSLAVQSGKFSNAGLTNLQRGTSALTTITQNSQKRDQAQNELKVLDFGLSGQGRQLRQGVLTQVGRSDRAASQGSYEGKSKQDILAENAALRSRIEKQFNNPNTSGPVKEVLGNLLTQLATADNKLKDKPAEEKGGSGSRGGSNRSSADRAERDRQRVETAIDKEEKEYRKELYDNQVKALENAPTLEDLPDLLDDVNSSLGDYLEAERELSLQQIKALKPTPEQEKKLTDAAARQAEQVRIGEVEKVGDVLTKAIKKFIDVTSDAIEKQYDEAINFTKRNLDIANARVQGLNNPIGSNDRPGYYKTIVQRQADVAQDRFNQAQIPANDRRISQYQELRARAVKTRDELEADLASIGIKIKKLEEDGKEVPIVVTAGRLQAFKALTDINQEINALDKETTDLINTNDALRASYQVLGETPNTFREGLSAAVQAVSIDVNAASSFGQELINNLDQPLRAVHEGFKNFFSDMLSGSVSVGQAFKRFAGTVIDSILEMAATAAANQIFKLFASLIPGSSPVGSSLGGGLASVGAWNGGLVKGYYGGGRINSGLSTRDSTLIHAAKGEYVMRRSAVDSLGTDMLDAMNSRGAQAIKGVGKTVIAPTPAPPVQTNVYVISPEEKPQLGPNDVIAIIANDVLKGGATKKLIKQVSNG